MNHRIRNQILSGDVSTKRLNKSISMIVFIFSLGLIYLAISGAYGYNDDYVILGLVEEGDWGYQTTLYWFTNLAANSGREVAAIFQSLAYPFTGNIENLAFIRIIGAIGWALSASYIFLKLKQFKLSSNLAFAISMLVIVIPGSTFLTMLSAGFIYSWIFLLALVIGAKATSQSKIVSKTFPFFILGALVVAFGYQPLLPAMLFFPIVKWLLSKKDRLENQYIIFQMAGLMYLGLGINYLYIRSRFSESRVDGTIDTFQKMQLLFKQLIPMIATPQMYLFLRPLSMLLSIFAIILLFGLWIYKIKFRMKITPTNIFINGNAMLGWMPLTSLWLLAVPENKLDFRRVFASSFILIATSIIAAFSEGEVRAPKENIGKLRNYAFSSLVLLSSMAWAITVNLSSTRVQEIEFSAALCASQKVKLQEGSEIASKYMSQNYPFKDFAFEDEFARQSLDFPNPRIFLPFMTDREVYGPEGLKTSSKLTVSLEGKSEGALWAKEFSRCFKR